MVNMDQPIEQTDDPVEGMSKISEPIESKEDSIHSEDEQPQTLKEKKRQKVKRALLCPQLKLPKKSKSFSTSDLDKLKVEQNGIEKQNTDHESCGDISLNSSSSEPKKSKQKWKPKWSGSRKSKDSTESPRITEDVEVVLAVDNNGNIANKSTEEGEDNTESTEQTQRNELSRTESCEDVKDPTTTPPPSPNVEDTPPPSGPERTTRKMKWPKMSALKKLKLSKEAVIHESEQESLCSEVDWTDIYYPQESLDSGEPRSTSDGSEVGETESIHDQTKKGHRKSKWKPKLNIAKKRKNSAQLSIPQAPEPEVETEQESAPVAKLAEDEPAAMDTEIPSTSQINEKDNKEATEEEPEKEKSHRYLCCCSFYRILQIHTRELWNS